MSFATWPHRRASPSPSAARVRPRVERARNVQRAGGGAEHSQRPSSSPRPAARCTETTRRCRRRRRVSPQPLAPYGASKLAGEAYVATWGRLHEHRRTSSCGSATSTGRGRRRTARPASSRSSATGCGDGEAPVVYGDGLQTRDYIHVADVAEAFLAAAESAARGDLQRRLGAASARCSSCSTSSSARPAHQRRAPLRAAAPRRATRSALDPTALRASGWGPAVQFGDGLAETFATLRVKAVLLAAAAAGTGSRR